MNHWTRLALRWSHLVFQGNTGFLTPRVRAMRLLEEALELAQAEGVTAPEVRVIFEQVYTKPKDLPEKEIGGVLMTVAAYCGTRGYDIEECFLREFERCMDPAIMAKVRNRNLSGDKIGYEPPIVITNDGRAIDHDGIIVSSNPKA